MWPAVICVKMLLSLKSLLQVKALNLINLKLYLNKTGIDGKVKSYYTQMTGALMRHQYFSVSCVGCAESDLSEMTCSKVKIYKVNCSGCIKFNLNRVKLCR